MKPKILFFDIETSPIISYVWGLFDQNVGLNQIQKDWHVLSWAAKWADGKEVMYQDQRGKRDIEDDKALLKPLWNLLDEADVLVGQNSKNFDQKKLNARFIYHGFKPPKPARHIDTLKVAKKHFGFTSNKLAYMTDKLCTKYKKLTHHKFEGFELWRECLKDNIEAWKEMERYNKQDVLSLEELYYKLAPWDTTTNLALYYDNPTGCRNCGGDYLQRRGFMFTSVGKYQRFQCSDCGAWCKDGTNLFTKTTAKEIKR